MQRPVSTKKKSPRRQFTPEFRAEAVRLVLEHGLTVSQASRDLGLVPSVLSHWVKQARIDAGTGPEGALTSEEKEELRQLRKENRELRMEREILKKAAAFFAKESS